MVSKIINKTPTKPKDRRTHRRKKSPFKNVVHTINKSIHSCQRRLIKIFTKLANLNTPNRRKRGFRLLKKTLNEESCPALPIAGEILPPLMFPDKKTVFLDLDETLIHSKPDPPPEKYDFVVRPEIDGEIMNFYVLKRPGVDELLSEIGKKFEIVVFTAGLKEYASLVLDRLDATGVIAHRLYRDSCREMDGKFVKDLSKLGRDLKRVVIVDDNPNAYIFQPENAVPITPFVDDVGDCELLRIMEFFEGASSFDDMRDAAAIYRSNSKVNLKLYL